MDREQSLSILLDVLTKYINNNTVWGSDYDENDIIASAIVDLAVSEVPGVKDIVNEFTNEGLFLIAPHYPGVVIRAVSEYINSRIRPEYEMR